MLRSAKQKLPRRSLFLYSICAYNVIFCHALRAVSLHAWPCHHHFVGHPVEGHKSCESLSPKASSMNPQTCEKSRHRDNVHYFPLFTTIAYIKMQEKINIFRQANLRQFRSSDLSPQSSSWSHCHAREMHLPFAHVNWSGLQVILPGEIVPFVQRIVEIE